MFFITAPLKTLAFSRYSIFPANTPPPEIQVSVLFVFLIRVFVCCSVLCHICFGFMCCVNLNLYAFFNAQLSLISPKMFSSRSRPSAKLHHKSTTVSRKFSANKTFSSNPVTRPSPSGQMDSTQSRRSSNIFSVKKGSLVMNNCSSLVGNLSRTDKP
jgi:hypothetical protein